MATTPIALPADPTDRASHVRVAVVAADQLASRRITAALQSSGLLAAVVTGSVAQLIRDHKGPEPDLVVLACDPGIADSQAAIRSLAEGFGQSHLVIVSSRAAGSGLRQAVNAGADGCVYERQLELTLGPTTRAVLVGHLCLPRELHRHAIKPVFSHREKQVLSMVIKGLGNRQIADQLFLAESTVKSHLASAFDKLGVRSRKEAAALLTDPDAGLGATLAGAGVDPA